MKKIVKILTFILFISLCGCGTSGHSIGSSSGKIRYGDVALPLHDIDDLIWEFDNYENYSGEKVTDAEAMDDTLTYSVYMSNRGYFDQFSGLRNHPNFQELKDSHGNTIECFMMSQMVRDDLFDYIIMETEIDNCKLTIEVYLKGQYAEDNYDYDRYPDYGKWISDNKEVYGNVSTEISDYIYLFDAIDFD